MKKKKSAKKEDMPEFYFKEFTPEESRIYEEAVNKFREAIAAGKTLRQSYEICSIADKELEALIQADFLKIVIAEEHFGKGVALQALAKSLSVSEELLNDTVKRMLQEAGVAAANQFGQQFGFEPKTND